MDRKEYMKDYMAKKRGVNKGVNKTPENVNKTVENVNKLTNVNRGVNKVILSDGQVWYPDPGLKAQREKAYDDNLHCMDDIRGDYKERKARAGRYAVWLASGKPCNSISVISTVEEVAELVNS